MTSTRNTASAMSACWVIWPPQLPLTALMLITFGEGTPSAPRGPKASNNACFTVTVWARESVSDRISTTAAGPVPAVCTDAGSTSMAFWKTSCTAGAVAGAVAVLAGNWICVPPVKSMPRLNPGTRSTPRRSSTSRPKATYQILRRPTMSNAPVPV